MSVNSAMFIMLNRTKLLSDFFLTKDIRFNALLSTDFMGRLFMGVFCGV